MENNSAVSVFLRIRSPQIWETNSPLKSYINYNESTDQMVIIEQNPFVFDKIFYPSTKEDEIFENVERNVDNLLRGYNSGIFAIGASGSGKTSTIFGLNNTKGLVANCLDSLYRKLSKEKEEEAVDRRISVQMIEIYNEKVFDLLTDQTSEIYTKGSTYAGSTSVPIQNTTDAGELLKKANKNRHVRSTLINASSSRSHAMFTICLKTGTAEGEITSVLHLVDLAGSEGVRTTNHKGIAQQEGVCINKGLLALGKVIEAHSNGKKVIPFRDSVLTTVLRDCLNEKSFLTLFACISPAKKNRNETLSTIRFAQKCKNLDSRVIPEMNTYLKEQQRLNVRTPFKPYMLPLQRNDTKTPGTAAVSSKASTIKSAGKNVGRYNSFITPSAKKAVVTQKIRHTDLPRFANESSRARETIENTTFSILNASTSTEVDTSISSTNLLTFPQQQPPQLSFSPLMRQIETTIDRKLAVFMESFRNQTITINGSTTSASAESVDKNSSANLFMDIRKAVRDGIKELESSMSESGNEEFAFTSTVIRSTTSNEQLTRVNRRLTSIDFRPQDDDCVRVFEATHSTQEDCSMPPPPPPFKSNCAPRRSTRISVMRMVVESKNQEKRVKPSEVTRQARKPLPKQNSLIDALYEPSLSKKGRQGAMLNLMNQGTKKELQQLPGIGDKTAYEIILKRAVKGKFKALSDVKKALAMGEKLWNKFMEKNLLI